MLWLRACASPAPWLVAKPNQIRATPQMVGAALRSGLQFGRTAKTSSSRICILVLERSPALGSIDWHPLIYKDAL